MNAELILRYNKELRGSLPIEAEGLTLYPVLYKDISDYQSFVSCLLYNPIYSEDVVLSGLPRLYFITNIFGEQLEQVSVERKILLAHLYGVLSLVLKGVRISFEPNKAGNFLLCVTDEKDPDKSVLINARQFETIREIILIQNDTPYNDEYIHPDILRWIEDQKKRERAHDSKKGIETEEDRIEVLMLAMSQPDEHFLDNMSIRRVGRLIEKTLGRDMYNAQIQGMMSGMVTFKEQPVSWVLTKPKQTDFEKYLKEMKAEPVRQ